MPMFCPGCKMLCDEDAIFCGNCGRQVAPLRAKGATAAEPVANLQASKLKPDTAYRRAIPRRPMVQVSPALPEAPFSPPPLPVAQTPAPAQPDIPHKVSSETINPVPMFPTYDHNRYLVRNIFISFLLILLIAGASAGLVTLAHNRANDANAKSALASGVSGQISFSDSQNGQGLTNALTLKITGLGTPPKDLHYYGWIIDAASEKTLSLGALIAQGRNFGLTFTNKNNLLAMGSQFEITQEQGNPEFPTGEVVLSGTLPPLALIHIRHLLVHFDTTPGKVGLLVGLRSQTRLLNTESELLKSSADDGPDKIGCVAQSIVNVIEGMGGQNARPLPAICAALNVADNSDGFGLQNPGNPNAGYIILSAEHASLAAIQSDATATIKMHAQHVQAATTNLKKWIATLDKDASQLVAHPNNTALISEITTISEHALNGVDQDDDGQVDPITGEAGAIIAYNEGQMMAQLMLGQGL